MSQCAVIICYRRPAGHVANKRAIPAVFVRIGGGRARWAEGLCRDVAHEGPCDPDVGASNNAQDQAGASHGNRFLWSEEDRMDGPDFQYSLPCHARGIRLNGLVLQLALPTALGIRGRRGITEVLCEDFEDFNVAKRSLGRSEAAWGSKSP